MRSATPNVGRTPVFSAMAGVTAAASSRATTPCRGAGLYGDGSAVYVDFRAGDVRRLVRSEEQDGVRHLVNLSRAAHRNDAHAFGPDSRIGGATRCAHW